MYIAMVLLLLLILPVSSLVIERYLFNGNSALPLLAGKWFVFWGVGLRLAVAGVRQILNPKFTAETILGIKSSESWIVVRELGFANLAIGAVGLGSILARGWLTPAAVAGGVFYGLAGINHLVSKNRNRLQNVAMVSDLFICGVLIWYCVAAA
jgi:hypothetical protein